MNRNDQPVSKESAKMSAPTFLDLFCGCGGFTLGMIRSGFRCLAAIDSDPTALRTLKENLGIGVAHLSGVDEIIEADMTRLRPEDVAQRIGAKDVDVIVGGPPCQGFSTARQVDGANHGPRIKRDRRRFLYRDFLRFVEYFQPKIFVMENVLGLRSAAGGDFFTRVQSEARSTKGPGYRVHAQVEDAFELGSPQKRKRQLIIGVRADLSGYFVPELRLPGRAVKHPNLGLAILDLPILRAGGGAQEMEYNLKRRAAHMATQGSRAHKFLTEVLEIERATKLTNHQARPHSARDLRDFALLREGEHAHAAMKNRGVRFEFPYRKSIFKDRYTRQSRQHPCSTIVAHLSKDGLMFIHPTQKRSLTPREAARVQTFPDWYRFPAARTSSFRLIGNAVPPVVAEAVGDAVALFLNSAEKQPPRPPLPISVSFRSKMQEQVRLFANMASKDLRSVENQSFLSGWYSVLFLLPHLHPESAIDHGTATEKWQQWRDVMPQLAPRHRRRFTRSGWPVPLADIAWEAWRRVRTNQLTREDLYGDGFVERLVRNMAEPQPA